MERLISIPAAPVFCGTGTYATDYGNMPHHLSVKDQRLRAKRECHAQDIHEAKPGPVNPGQAKEIKELSERGRHV